MAIDNLTFYSNGLPAGQQTDRYSSQPGCLRSKNLDIFSSSKSVKATAWSNPTTTDADIVKQDGKLILKTDGKVYERGQNGDTLVVDPSVNFPVYQVSYNGENGTYADAQRGTVQDLVAKYEGDELKSYTVFTDRASYTWSSVKFIPNKSFSPKNLSLDDSSPLGGKGYLFTKISTSTSTATIDIVLENGHFAKMPILIKAVESNLDDAYISLDHVKLTPPAGYYYDAQLDGMIPRGSLGADVDIPFSGNINDGILIEVPTVPSGARIIRLEFIFTKKGGASTYGWSHGELYIDINNAADNYRMTINGVKSDGDYNEYYSYLPVRERKLVSVGDYGYSESFWMKGSSFQPLYKWVGSWTDVNGEKKIRYDFTSDMGWESDVSMDVIDMIIWNEQVYMIGNLDGNGYIIPCDLTGGRGTPYIAYGCEFKGAVNIDYLLYLVGEDRWVSQLWVYNGQEMVSILGGNEEKDTINLIKTDEQFRFDGKMIEYRDNLILSTTDNRIFAYGQTYGGKGGVFIHQIPGTITDLKADGKDLIVEYEASSTKYLTRLQDDTPIRNYNTEWEAEYPIILGNHLLEKEESDLFVSYILPNSSSKLEFWGMANHYHFWTFKSTDIYAFSPTADYKLKGCTGSYKLRYIETNGGEYTFRLEGDLPIQNGNDMKITDANGTELITYTGYNHFRKIGEITTAGYQEGEFRFHNLNNKLELPKSHSLQIMVRGKGTANYTPELFALDLVANQRDRG